MYRAFVFVCILLATAQAAPENDLAARFLAKAQKRIADRKYADAIAQCNLVIRWKATLAEPYEIRGLAYAYSGNREKAIEDFGEAIKRNPDSTSAYEKRARLYQAAENLDAAIEDYTVLIRLRPKEAAYYRMRAFLYRATNRREQALQDMDQVVQLMPACSECLDERLQLARQ